MNAIGEGTPSQPSNFVTLPQQGLISLSDLKLNRLFKYTITF